MDNFKWKKRPGWNSPPEKEQVIELPYKKVHLYDGGVYDNLGIEPLFDTGKQEFKNDIDFLIVSDAGKPLERSNIGGMLNPFRAKRIADIALDQTRALRVRPFVNFIQKNKSAGLYLQIGITPENHIKKYEYVNPIAAKNLYKESWMQMQQIDIVKNYPTNLRSFEKSNFNAIERHGYETTKWNHILFLEDQINYEKEKYKIK